EEIDVPHVVALVVRVDGAVIGKEHRRDIRHGFAAFADLDRVLIAQFLARALLGREVAGARAHGEFEDDDRIRAEAAQNIGYRCVETGEDGAHTDDRPGADDDAEHGEEGTQLVPADRLQRQYDSVGEGELGHYRSTRRASIGSRREARRAG